MRITQDAIDGLGDEEWKKAVQMCIEPVTERDTGKIRYGERQNTRTESQGVGGKN